MNHERSPQADTRSAEDFAAHRPLLFALAYRMLGSVADAEDVLHDAWLKWCQAPRDPVRSPKALLATIVTRLCIDQLRSARVRREEYVGTWLPEPLVGASEDDPEAAPLLAESLTTAFLLLLERLSSVERAVFLLHEVFGFDFGEVAQLVGKSEPAARQIGKRARDKLARGDARFPPRPEEAEQLARRFADACATGDLQAFLAIVSDDVVLLSDGGGKARAALLPVIGRERVGRFFAGIVRKWPYRFREAWVNGTPGLVVWIDDGPPRVISFSVRDGRIERIFFVSNPDKLPPLAE